MPATQPREPAPLWQLLNADQEQVLTDVVEQLGQLSARIVLLHLAVRRRGACELTEARLERLGISLREATEDARAAQRAWARDRS
jgi:hypothetical protein